MLDAPAHLGSVVTMSHSPQKIPTQETEPGVAGSVANGPSVIQFTRRECHRAKWTAVDQASRFGWPPRLNIRHRHRSSSHCHFLDGDLTTLVLEARCRRRPRNFNCSIGLGTGSGTRVSSRSNTPSARHTRMKPDNWVATVPASSRSTVRLETPACLANWPWGRLRSSRMRANRVPSSARTASSVVCLVICITRQIWRVVAADPMELAEMNRLQFFATPLSQNESHF
jgi:hypothetical protein